MRNRLDVTGTIATLERAKRAIDRAIQALQVADSLRSSFALDQSENFIAKAKNTINSHMTGK